MILVDSSILLYAYDKTSDWYGIAEGWLAKTFATEPVVRLAEVTVLGFLRIVTDVRMVRMARPVDDAVRIVSGWLARANVDVLEPSSQHWSLLSALLIDSRTAGARVTDAHLATLAIEHGATLYTNDRDFRRFPGLSVRFPLLDSR